MLRHHDLVHSKTDLPFKFCKIGLKNTLFISGSKMVVCCLFVVCLFVVAIFLPDFGLLTKKN